MTKKTDILEENDKLLKKEIGKIMEEYMLYEEGSGSANWNGKYTKRVLKVVEEAIKADRRRLIKILFDEWNKYMKEVINGVEHPPFEDVLNKRLNKEKGGDLIGKKMDKLGSR